MVKAGKEDMPGLKQERCEITLTIQFNFDRYEFQNGSFSYVNSWRFSKIILASYANVYTHFFYHNLLYSNWSVSYTHLTLPTNREV